MDESSRDIVNAWIDPLGIRPVGAGRSVVASSTRKTARESSSTGTLRYLPLFD